MLLLFKFSHCDSFVLYGDRIEDFVMNMRLVARSSAYSTDWLESECLGWERISTNLHCRLMPGRFICHHYIVITGQKAITSKLYEHEKRYMACSCLDCYRLQIYGPETIQLINLIINYGYCFVKTKQNSDNTYPIWRKHKLIWNPVIQVISKVITDFNSKSAPALRNHMSVRITKQFNWNQFKFHLSSHSVATFCYAVVFRECQKNFSTHIHEEMECFITKTQLFCFSFLIKLSGNNKTLYHSNHLRWNNILWFTMSTQNSKWSTQGSSVIAIRGQ